MDIDTEIQIAPPEDVFALKLRAIHDRIALKDFLDVAEFIRQGYSLGHAMLGARALIEGMLPPAITIKTLMWYDDPEFDGFTQHERKAHYFYVRDARIFRKIKLHEWKWRKSSAAIPGIMTTYTRTERSLPRSGMMNGRFGVKK